MRAYLLTAVAALALSACSPARGPAGGDSSQSTSAETAATDAAASAKDGAGAAPLQVALPQLAYAYKLGFRLPGDRIGRALEAHRSLCEQMGPARCQLLALTNSAADDAQGSATLKVRVASGEARRFSDAATKAVAQAGGRAVMTDVAAEDVSKNIVDAQARIAQRELLVSRLTEILRTRTGKVSELVEAERSVAQAQEELDQAKGWLAELRGRVAMSDFEISYTATAPAASAGSAGTQLGEAVSGSFATFLIGLRGLLTLFIYLLPWMVLAVPVVFLVRALRRRTAKPGAQAIAPERPDAERALPDEA